MKTTKQASGLATALFNALEAYRPLRFHMVNDQTRREHDEQCEMIRRHAASMLPRRQPEGGNQLQEAIDWAPDALRRLGEHLVRALNEDQWPAVESLILECCEAFQPNHGAVIPLAVAEFMKSCAEASGIINGHQLAEVAQRLMQDLVVVPLTERDGFESAMCTRFGFTPESIASHRLGYSYNDGAISWAFAMWKARGAIAAPYTTPAQAIQAAFKDGYRSGVDDELVDEEAAWNRSRAIHIAHDAEQHGATPPAALDDPQTEARELFAQGGAA